MLLKSILYSGFDFTEEEKELKFQYLFFNSLLLFNVFVVSIVFILRYVNDQHMQAFFDFCYIFLCIVVVFISHFSKKYFEKIVAFVIFYSFIIVFFVVYKENNSIINVGWLFVLLVTTSFLLKKRNKIFVFLVFIFLVIFVEIMKYEHTYLNIFFSIVPFLVVMLFLYFFDKKNENIQAQLELANTLLKDNNIKLDEEVQSSQYEIFKFKQIFEKSPVSILVTNEKGDIKYANPWFSKISGYRLEELIGKNPRVLKSELLSDEFYKKLWEDISSGKVWNGIFKNISKSGKEYWESALIAPVNDKNGKIINYISVKQEITKRVYLEEQLKLKKAEIKNNLEKTLESFVYMIERRDTYTGGHSKRVAEYSLLIAKDMNISKEDCDFLYRAAILHDIGKIATPDSILLKPSKLTAMEYQIIKEHVSSSYDILVEIPMYKELADIIICHHERYDGKGYPKGLKEDEIPLLSQIMIVADAFDAMITNRIYKGRKNIFEAIEELKKYAGKQFHPKVVQSAIKSLKQVNLKEDIFQHPISDKEKERFSDFYKDQITGANSSFYLEFILSQKSFKERFSFITILYLHNFNDYNKKHGWGEGNKLLEQFSKYLIDKYKNATVFRVFGDDFVLLSRDYLEIEIDFFINLDIFKNSNIRVSKKELDLMIEDVVELEKLEMSEYTK